MEVWQLDMVNTRRLRLVAELSHGKVTVQERAAYPMALHTGVL